MLAEALCILHAPLDVGLNLSPHEASREPSPQEGLVLGEGEGEGEDEGEGEGEGKGEGEALLSFFSIFGHSFRKSG